MPISDSQLDFNHHLDFFRKLGSLTGDPTRDAHCYRQAEHMHVLSVTDAIRDIHFESGALAQSISSANANFHLRFGVSRRSKSIWIALRGIFAHVQPDRSEPLLMEQVEEVARDLNIIYINIRGTLDNLAWFLLDFLAGAETRKLPPVKVGLFNDKFLKDERLKEVANCMKQFRDWNRDLSSRRDPAAHRIPLTVPPAFIDNENRLEFRQASEDYTNATSDAFRHTADWEVAAPKFEKAEILFDKLQHVGKFMPVFVHHPNEGMIRIYPTVPEDIAQLVRIARGIFEIARKSS